MLLSTLSLSDLLLNAFHYPLLQVLSKHFPKRKLPFPTAYKRNTAQFWSCGYQYGLFENYVCSLIFWGCYQIHIIWTINTDLSQGKGVWVTFREAWTVTSGVLSVRPLQSQWKELMGGFPLCSLLAYETHALSLLRFLLIFPEGPWLRVTITLCLRPCGHGASPSLNWCGRKPADWCTWRSLWQGLREYWKLRLIGSLAGSAAQGVMLLGCLLWKETGGIREERERGTEESREAGKDSN